jgi:hypothetical protein
VLFVILAIHYVVVEERGVGDGYEVDADVQSEDDGFGG